MNAFSFQNLLFFKFIQNKFGKNGQNGVSKSQIVLSQKPDSQYNANLSTYWRELYDKELMIVVKHFYLYQHFLKGFWIWLLVKKTNVKIDT